MLEQADHSVIVWNSCGDVHERVHECVTCCVMMDDLCVCHTESKAGHRQLVTVRTCTCHHSACTLPQSLDARTRLWYYVQCRLLQFIRI